MFKSFFIWAFMLMATLLSAQKANITGIVADSSGNHLSAASVVLMEVKDSIIAQFGVSNTNGVFNLKKVDQGDYLLQISYIGMESHYQAITVSSDRNLIDLGKTRLIPGNFALNGVEITADRSPLRMSNDTVTYNAAYFKTHPGSVVEDLLKKLPGIEVQSDGTIKAQGEVVQNVMVDGKSFFGNDPKIATKNLPADAVDKVQLYDKKSDRAEFTGIEDGRDEKTINLQLKAGAKAGYFGNVSAGYGDKNRFEGKFNINRFAGRTQLSALGSANNTNQQSFSLNDYINFMGGFANLLGGGGSGGRVRIGMDDANGILPGMGPSMSNGFTTAHGGGLNLNHDFSKKTEFNAHYFYNRIQYDLDRVSARQNFLENQWYDAAETDAQLNKNSNHRLQMTLKTKLDSSQHLTFRTKWALNDATANTLSTGSTALQQSVQTNTYRNYDAIGDSWRGEGSAIYKKRFAKKGRAFVADAGFQKNSDQRAGQLVSSSFFSIDSFSNIRQRQRYADEASNWNAGVSFSEPLGHKQYLEWQASHRQYTNDSDKSYFDTLDVPTPGEVFNPYLSRQFQRGYRYSRTGLSYMVNRPTWNVTAGLNYQYSALDGQQANQADSRIQRSFSTALPMLSLNYEPKLGRIFNLDYNTGLREPSLEQLIPAVDNSNPLSVYIGNPALRPEYIHEANATVMLFDAFSNTSFFAGSSLAYTLNRITNASTVDAYLRTTLQPVNVRYDINLEHYAEFSRPFKPLKITCYLNMNSTFNKGLLWLNGNEQEVNRWNNSIGMRFENRRTKRMELSMGGKLTHNTTHYLSAEALDQQFFNQKYFTDIKVFPTSRWSVGTSMDYYVFSGTVFGETRHVPLWKAGVTYYCLKNRKGQVRFEVNDILNKNIGITRNSRLNYTEEVRTINLSRYFMVTFGYSLSGFSHQPKGGIQIENIRG